jgi:periplasmic copper chaperone A
MHSERRTALIAAVWLLASFTFANPPAPSVRVDAASIRWLPAGVPAGGYATLTNFGDRPEVLTAAMSPAFGSISIHRSVRRGAIVQMEPVNEILINPHSTLDFESMGYHFMLFDARQSLEHTAQVDLTLYFKDGGSISAAFKIRKPD